MPLCCANLVSIGIRAFHLHEVQSNVQGCQLQFKLIGRLLRLLHRIGKRTPSQGIGCPGLGDRAPERLATSIAAVSPDASRLCWTTLLAGLESELQAVI